MIFKTPGYYNKFKCTAEKCKDNCCIGWEIDIDDATTDIYRNISGDFGKRLSSSISGNSFILDKDERCPFLNNKNLCDIYIQLGEKNLCQICTDHPRFFEWFDGVKEGGIGLCCEAAARLILTEEFDLIETEISFDESQDYNDDLYKCLCKSREIIFEILSNNPLNKALCMILDFAEELQKNIDNEIFDIPIVNSSDSNSVSDISFLLTFLSKLEPIGQDWIPYLNKCLSEKNCTNKLPDKCETYLRRIALYFIYRYFLKGVFDWEILSRVKLAVISVAAIKYLWRCEFSNNSNCDFDDLCEIARKYSKEIEYCEENLEVLQDATYSEFPLSSDYLKGLL